MTKCCSKTHVVCIRKKDKNTSPKVPKIWLKIPATLRPTHVLLSDGEFSFDLVSNFVPKPKTHHLAPWKINGWNMSFPGEFGRSKIPFFSWLMAVPVNQPGHLPGCTRWYFWHPHASLGNFFCEDSVPTSGMEESESRICCWKPTLKKGSEWPKLRYENHGFRRWNLLLEPGLFSVASCWS